MYNSEIINRILFEWENLEDSILREYCKKINPKMLRWLGANHPDNKTRRIFFEETNIVIGEGTVINQNFIVSDDYEPLLTIGNRVAISPNVTIICASAPNNSHLAYNSYVKDRLITHKVVNIANDVWIGANVVILPGVHIGAQSIVGAGSIVTKNIMPECIYAGNPAKFIRSL